jgi:signal transduction histidine kinase
LQREDLFLENGMKRLLSVVNVFSALTVFSQVHTTYHFSVPEGLPSSEVYEVYQDKKGFLWFASDNGVARYDGQEFRTFDMQDGLPDPVVFGFFEDAKERIWFRTFSGRLSYFDGTRINKYRYNRELINAEEKGLFNFLFDTGTGALWFTSGHALGRIDSSGHVTTHQPHRPFYFVQSINGKLLQAAGNRYSVKNVVINDQQFPIQLTDTVGFQYFNSIAVEDKIYVSIYKDIFEWHNNKLRHVLASEHPIISLSKDRHDDLWVGYLNHGVEHFSDLKKAWTPDFLHDKSVTKVLEDNSSGFWFTTLESGVYHVPDFRIENFRLPSTSRLKTVLTLGDTVLAADQSGDLFFIDGHNKNVVSRKNYHENLYGIFEDSRENIWLSTGLTLKRLDPSFHTRRTYDRLIGTSFSEDHQGTVWVLDGSRITQFDTRGVIVNRASMPIIYRTALVDDSSLYLAGRTGLHVRDKELKLVKEPKAFAELKITQIESLNDTTLLLATQGNGLILVDKTNWSYKQFSTKKEFLANNIYCLLKTDSTLWLGTERGLVAVNTSALLRDNARFYSASQRTGLIGDKITSIVEVENDVWAFADNGFSVIPKSFAQNEFVTPIFYIKDVVAGVDTATSIDALLAKPPDLAYSNNNFAFSFGYISFSNQELFLRYRISAKGPWLTTQERSIQFSSLAPDEYAFELQFSDDNTHWTSAFAAIPFRIDLPWWRKWYTMTAAVAFVLLLGYMYFRHRQSIYTQKNHYLSIINEHQQKLIRAEIDTRENERKRIARELHDGVGTNLTAIKLMVNQLLQHHLEPRTKDIEEMFQTALKELTHIIYGLTPPSLARYGLFAALRNYISRLNRSLSPSISLQTFGKEINHYDFNIMVFRIVQELISNSIKHASASHINIHVNAFDDMFSIIYEDDGIGFTHAADQHGLGLSNIESRVQTVNGNIKFDSGGHGVCYTIDIPLNTIRERV